MESPFFGDDVEGYLKWLHANDHAAFKFVVYKMAQKKLGLGGVHTDGDGSCTSQNCFGTTGCHATTTNGYCACSSPNGPCVWVPGV